MSSSILISLLSVYVMMLALAEVTASVSVELKDQPPQMKANYETSVVAEVATTARIICPVYGTEDRKPLVTWTRNGNLVHIGWDRYRTSRAGLTLLIDNVQEMDNGLYTCSASNGFGTVIASLQLTVLSSANFTAYVRESTTSKLTSLDLAMAQLNTEDHDDTDESSLMIFNDVDVRVEAVTSSFLTNAIDETEYDVIMTSLLCMGSAVVMASLGALIATAVRRRVQYRRNRRAVVSELSAHRLLAGDKQSYLYYPTATITSCSTLIGSHWAERHNDVGQPASPKGGIAMGTANELVHGQRCGACVNRESNERQTGDQRATNGLKRLTLTWPQTAVDCDSSYCYCSTFGSLESCSASV